MYYLRAGPETVLLVGLRRHLTVLLPAMLKFPIHGVGQWLRRRPEVIACQLIKNTHLGCAERRRREDEETRRREDEKTRRREDETPP